MNMYKYAHVIIALIVKNQKYSKYPLLGEWLTNLWYIHVYEIVHPNVK